MDAADWRHVQPRIPDTPQRRQLERQRSVRNFVFGAKDGILTTMGILTGIGIASGGRLTVIISGLLALIAGALSMGVGEYQGSKSEREVVQASVDVERGEMEAHPQEEFAEQVAYYKVKGFSSEEAQMIVTRLTKNPEIYLYEMMRDEFGIDPRVAEQSGLFPAFAMAGSYALGSVIPIVPYFVGVPLAHAVFASGIFALCGLFGIGAVAGRMGGRNPWLRGLEIAMYGTVVFVISFLAGHYIPPLFGYTPMGLGG
ncbi:MAG: VIT1/CCC1 transporter family protein [Vulcanimicrobiaceae bacterium]